MFCCHNVGEQNVYLLDASAITILSLSETLNVQHLCSVVYVSTMFICVDQV